MRVPIKWLREYVDFPLCADELAELVTNAGLEVGRIERVGVEGAPLVWAVDRVLLAQVLKVERHPDADRLVLATVDHGAGEPKVVVTGAPNLFPFIGRDDLAGDDLYSPLLLEGGTYLDPYKDGRATRLKGKKLRGVYNDAMLCSEVELGLGDDADGILLATAEEIAPLYEGELAGAPLQAVLGDEILDIDIIPNVARCASMIGVAREVAALVGSELRPPDCSVLAEGEPVGDRVRISTESPELNPRFVALLIEGIEQRPAPLWMRHRLRLAGQRPIDVVVDVSNYVMLEIGQPNHSFDFDFLEERARGYDDEGRVHIVTRLARPGEEIETLDGEKRELRGNNMLVTDEAGPLSLAGVMGGAESEIRETTTRVLLEAAAWNFINVRHTARQHQLLSEAAFRFSRGVHPSQTILGAQRAAELLRLSAGATVARGVVDYEPLPREEITVGLDAAYVRRLSGLDLGIGELATLLERLGFRVATHEDSLEATVPDHRLDIAGPHDLVEEICRMYGYDRIPSTILSDDLPPQRGNESLEREERIKDLLVEQGLFEVVTYRLTTEDAIARTGAVPSAPETYVRLVNPSTSERVVLRHSLLDPVLEIAARNTRFRSSVRIFEIGDIYVRHEGESEPSPQTHLAIVFTGLREAGHFADTDTAPPFLDLYDLKGAVESLAESLAIDIELAVADNPTLRPGAGAVVSTPDGTVLGLLGELHPGLVDGYGFRLEDDQAVLVAILYVDEIAANMKDRRTISALPAFPPVHEDLALVVATDRSAGDVEKALRKAGGPLLRNVELFDVYEGDRVGEGKKSLAYHLSFQAPNRTLRDKDAEKARNRILRTLEKSLGATLRE